jgi:hypothetical protein
MKSDASAPPTVMEEIAGAIPDDLVALRPEDIRVEAEFVDLVVNTNEPTIDAQAFAVERGPAEFSSESVASESNLAGVSEPSQQAALNSTEQPPLVVGMGAALPGIKIDPPSILPSGADVRQVREIVLQPAVVLAWSLLVLMSLPMAFLAGLLIGHFIWKSP